MNPFENSSFPLRLVSEVCEPTETTDPRKFPQNKIFYVDIASVSNADLKIDTHKEFIGAEAPSRARKKIRTNDVIFATTRPYLHSIALVPESYNDQVCSTGFCVLRSNKIVLSEWLFFCVISDEFMKQITPKMRGANYPAVTDKDIFSAFIPIPPIEEQQRIVGRIKECLSRIDEMKQLREASRKEAESLEESIFGDFLEDAKSEGCKVVNLGDILIKSQYGTSAKASVDVEGFPVLRMGNIKSGHLDFSDLKYMNLTDKDLEKYRLNIGDILINRTNSMELVGKSAVFQKQEGDWVFASYLVRLTVDTSKAIPEFVNASINSRVGRAYVYATARRAIGMVNINAKEIAKMPLPLPSLEKQKQIVNRIKEARNATQLLLSDLIIEPIELLTTAILRKAFAGEL